MKLHSSTAVGDLVNHYAEIRGTTVHQYDEGVLGMGCWILYDASKTYMNYVIKEVAISDWSSGHTIRRYKRLPKKYQTIINRL